jgi:hypothetical protein
VKSLEETPRLIDDPEIGRELELGLERMSSNLPSAEQLAGMAARLGVTPNPAPASGSAPVSKTLLKLAAGAGISGAVLWAILQASAPSPTTVPVPSPSPVPSETSHVEGAAPVEPATPVGPNRRAPGTPNQPAAPAATAAALDDSALSAPTPPVPATETPEVSTPSPRTPGASPRANEAPAPTSERPSERPAAKAPGKAPVPTSDDATTPGRPPTASPPGETALLRDARLALNGEPARALALTEQHRRDYPSGGFTQEREVIAITALARLGRTSEARSRADRFRSAYPTSPYIERIDRAVPP